jgi:hypothetical protein
MTREQAEQIARSVLTAVNADTSWPSVNHVANAIMETAAVERADEREACANIVADAAPGFCGGRAETVLYSVAETIRARGEQHRR